MTQTLQFTEGTQVVSADGNDLGKVERLVADPRRKQISHLVLSKGFFFPEERVVPVAFVARADEDQITLNEEVDLDDLARFEESYYVRVEEADAYNEYPPQAAGLLVWGYPAYGAGGPAPTYSRHMATPRVIERTDRNIPDDEVAVTTGADVFSSDGEKVGSVAGAEVTDGGAIVAIEVDPGWFREPRMIPAHFIASIDARSVRLGLPASSLEAWRQQN